MKFVHFAENSHMDKFDKAYKIPLHLEKTKLRFSSKFFPKQSLNYDGTTTKYFGGQSCKKFFRGK